jgi:hypothetical protein
MLCCYPVKFLKSVKEVNEKIGLKTYTLAELKALLLNEPEP